MADRVFFRLQSRNRGTTMTAAHLTARAPARQTAQAKPAPIGQPHAPHASNACARVRGHNITHAPTRPQPLTCDVRRRALACARAVAGVARVCGRTPPVRPCAPHPCGRISPPRALLKIKRWKEKAKKAAIPVKAAQAAILSTDRGLHGETAVRPTRAIVSGRLEVSQ